MLSHHEGLLKMRRTLSNVLTLLLVSCALVVAGLAVVERFDTSQEASHFERWRKVAEAGQHVWGPENAGIKIIEFADFQCPHCRSMQRVLNTIRKRYSSDVAIVRRHLPIINALSRKAAIASECAARQGKFTAYHDVLFKHQEQLDAMHFDSLARMVEIPDVGAFTACVEQEQTANRVERDVELAERMEIEAVPTLVVGNTIVTGAVSTQVLDSLVQVTLRAN